MASLGLQEIMILLVLGTSLWVLFDAINLKVTKGKIEGFFDMGVAGWFFACLLLWIVGFPAYLVKRDEYKRLKENGRMPLDVLPSPRGTISRPVAANIAMRYQDKPTEELLDILQKNDRATYRDEVFEAIRQILVDRKCELPVQAPSLRRQTTVGFAKLLKRKQLLAQWESALYHREIWNLKIP
jgi:hypothetical protein